MEINLIKKFHRKVKMCILNKIKFGVFFASRFKHMQIRVNAESAAFYRSETNLGFIPPVLLLFQCITSVEELFGSAVVIGYA